MLNKIETIESGTFKNLVKLSKIDLSQNRLNKIEKYSFQNMSSLVLLNLSHNYLDQLIDVFDRNIKIFKLDVSFNFIKQLENSQTLTLGCLNLNDNGYKSLTVSFFGRIIIQDLFNFNMGSNQLSFLNNFIFYNLSKIAILYLNDNKFTTINSIGFTSLIQLELIDLSNNVIQYVNENDFKNFKSLKSINLNNNPLKFLQDSSFKSLNKLESLKIAKNNLETFNLRILNSSEYIFALDLSFNNITFESLENLKSIHKIKLEKVKFLGNNSFKAFLNEFIIELDFSQNDLSSIFEKFCNLTNIEILMLKKVFFQY